MAHESALSGIDMLRSYVPPHTVCVQSRSAVAPYSDVPTVLCDSISGDALGLDVCNKYKDHVHH